MLVIVKAVDAKPLYGIVDGVLVPIPYSLVTYEDGLVAIRPNSAVEVVG